MAGNPSPTLRRNLPHCHCLSLKGGKRTERHVAVHEQTKKGPSHLMFAVCYQIRSCSGHTNYRGFLFLLRGLSHRFRRGYRLKQEARS